MATQTLHPSNISWSAHLVGAGDAQSVEDWDKDLGRDGWHDGIGEAEDPEGGAVAVGLCRRANDGDAGHEAGRERHGNRHGCHLPSAQQELGTAGLLTAPDGLEEADAGRKQDCPGKHHIVPDREGGHLPTCANHDSFSSHLGKNW